MEGGHEGFKDKDLVYTHAAKVRRRRQEKNISQEALSERAGISRGTLEFMEGKLRSGGRIRCEWFNLRAVAEVLNISPYELLDWSTQQPVPAGVAQDSFERNHLNPVVTSTLAVLRRVAIDPSPLRVRAALENAAVSLRSLVGSESIQGAARIYTRVLSRLAEIESRYEKRVGYRRTSIEVLRRSYAAHNDPLDLVSWSDSIVNYHYDLGPSAPSNWLQKQIPRAQEKIRSAVASLEKEGNRTVALRVLLVAQSASLHRCSFAYLPSDMRRRRLSTMLTSSQVCLRLAPHSAIALLASAQAHWTYALQVNDAYTSSHFRTAEDQLLAAAGDSSLARLVLARFYRLTYRPLEAINTFRLFETTERDRRLVLHEAHLAAEAARQLWMRKGDSVLDTVVYARHLISEAVEAGYIDARNICDLAFLEGILGELQSGVSVLLKLRIGDDVSQVKQWDEVMSAAVTYVESNDIDKLRLAFTFGFDHGHAWNSLGTFSLDFMHDPELALKLYDAGLKLSPLDHVLWYNRARVLRVLGRHGEVSYSLRNARQYAHSAFVPFLDDFERASGTFPERVG